VKDSEHYDALVDATMQLQEHLFYSEFGGHLDYSDPWMPLYNGLVELRGKLKEEKEMCESLYDVDMDNQMWDNEQ